MTDLLILGQAGEWTLENYDNGDHFGFELKSCPYCGDDSALQICHDHPAKFWVECQCGAHMKGDCDESISFVDTEEEARKGFSEAIDQVVEFWNSRA